MRRAAPAGRALSPAELRILERLEGRHLPELEIELAELLEERARLERVAQLARDAGAGQASGPEEGGP